MSAFIYGVFLQWRLDFRNKGIVLTYYVVPLLFFMFMGGIFTSIDPDAKLTLVQVMTVFAGTMGAFLGYPTPLVELCNSDIKKAYKVGNIPFGISIVNNFISGFVHLLLVSIIIFFIAPIMFNASVPDDLLLYFTVLVMFIVASLLIGTIIGLFVKSVNKLTMVSQLLFLPSIMLSGIMFDSNMLPKTFGFVGKVFPATWAYSSMCEAGFSDLSIIQFILTIFITVTIIILRIRYLKAN